MPQRLNPQPAPVTAAGWTDVGAILAGLEAGRDQARKVADLADEAIGALTKLQAAMAGGAPAQVRKALPPQRAAAAAPAVDRNGHVVHGEARPRTAVCKNGPCGKTFATKGVGRVPHYCSDVCRTVTGKRLRRAAQEQPSRPAADVDDVLAPPPPIPESGAAMRDRIRRTKVGGGPTFLDRARERNDEAARRNGVARKRAS